MSGDPSKIEGKKKGGTANLTNAGKGRPKGVPNKATTLAKNAIAEVAEKLGGATRMVAWVKEDPKNEAVFWGSIYPKLLPLQVTGADGGAIKTESVIDLKNAPLEVIKYLAGRHDDNQH